MNAATFWYFKGTYPAVAAEAQSSLLVPQRYNRFQVVLDMMETLNTRGKRSALLRGASGGRTVNNKISSPDHRYNVFYYFSINLTDWMYYKSGIGCKNIS